MAISAGLVRPVAQIQASALPLVTNIPVLANTEYSHTLAGNTKQFLIKARTAAKLQVSFIALDTNTIFFTLPSNTSYSQDQLSTSGSIYFRSNKATDIEILEWS